MMAPVMSIASGLLIFVLLIIFAPTIAGSIENAQPAMDPASDWNKTNNADLPSGVEQWTQNIQILSVVVLIISIAVAMFGGKCLMAFLPVETISRAWRKVRPLSGPLYWGLGGGSNGIPAGIAV